jgi:arsenate reductase
MRAMSLPGSDDQILLLHNPRCSKSRALRTLLEERGVAFEERRYLEDPLDREELEELHTRLGRPVIEWTRSGEPAFGEAGLEAQASDETLLDAIAAHPILLERPVLVRGRRAALGRPPEKALELL